MRIVMFYHSLISDWNHGNAHFLRGVVAELKARGHDTVVYEPRDAWSVQNLIAERGESALDDFRVAYPNLTSIRYDPSSLDLNAVLEGADLVLVHEWNEHDLVAQIGKHRARHGGYVLLFHDTHHRAVTDSGSMAAYDLSHYDGVLAFGAVISDLYRERRWSDHVWTWHEAADARVFGPKRGIPREGDLVWIGNWGDDERTAELQEFLIDPVRELRLQARIHGVRYPDSALHALRMAGIEYAGWLPNYRAPEVFAAFSVTVHVPRLPYVEALPGIPTIRVFEALACGIPLISAPWNDSENLFTPGEDFWVAHDGEDMKRKLRLLLNEPKLARALAERGRRTVLQKHTCAHRVDELMAIYGELKPTTAASHAQVAATA